MSDVTPGKHGVFKRLYHGETRADIVGRWKMWFAISGVLLLIGFIAIGTRGLNLGIDFTGGTIWKVAAGDATAADVTKVVEKLGYGEVQVQEVTEHVGGKDVRQFQVETDASAKPTKATTTALDKARSTLKEARSGLDEASRKGLDDAASSLAAVDGPFAQDVPKPLAELQKRLEGLKKKLSAVEGKEQVALAASEGEAITTAAETLANLEDTQRRLESQDVSNALAKATGTKASDITVDEIGPSWGKQISDKAQTALVVFILAITLFITIRFEWKMAIATVAALFHDLLLVVGLYALFGFTVTPSTVVALLTMLGFSIYDGIVVFDRVNENTKLLSGKSKMNYTEMANLSLNQVLMRSLNTSITTLLPILSVLVVGAYVLGATTLEEFGLALLLGLISGAYSSLFIATPILALLKEREPRYKELRQQIAERGHGTVVEIITPVDDDPVRTAVTSGNAPRPRKQGRKR